MRKEARLRTFIDRIYAFATDERALSPALDSLVDLVDGAGAFMMVSDPSVPQVQRSDSVGLGKADLRAYQSHWFSEDVRMPRAFLLPTMQPMSESDLVEPRHLRNSAIFNEFLLPSDIPHILALWLDKSPRRAASISLQRNRADGAFTAKEAGLLQLAAPHLKRALKIKDRLSTSVATQAGLMAAMDSLPFALLLVDAVGTVLEASRPARRHLENRHGIFLSAGQLRCLDSNCDRRLQIEISRAVHGWDLSRSVDPEPLGVARPGQAGTLVLSVLPIAKDDSWISTGRAAAIVLAFADWEAPAPTREALLRLYRLTPAESALTCLLLGGSSLAEAADRLQIAVSTARTQVKAVFGKVGARSQSDLVRRILTGVGVAPP